MLNREKVIQALECMAEQRKTCKHECPYRIPVIEALDIDYCYCAKTNIIKDALTLLKEQAEIIDRYHKADAFLYAHGWRWG